MRKRWLMMAVLLFLLAPAASLAAEPAQTALPALTGRVVDTEGRPLAGVKIWTSQSTEEQRQGREPQPLAITGPDGRFVLRSLQPFPLLAVCPVGWVYGAVQLAGRPPFLPLEFPLHRSTRISGRVVDKSGEPAAGVSVWASREGHGGGCIRQYVPPPCLHATEPRSGVTDSAGRFVFEGLEPGWFEIRVSEEGEQQVVRRRGPAGQGIEGIEFVLSRNSLPVEGRVVDADGAAVIGAQVTLSGARPEGSFETDPAGEFHIPGAFSGRNHLRVEHPDQGWIEQDVEIEGRPARLDVRMPPVTLVQGRILGPDGAPVKQVFLQDETGYIDVADDGSFRFTAPPGEHEIVGHSFEPEGTVRDRFQARGEPIDLDLRLVRSGTIQIRLTGLPPQEGNVDLKDRPEHLNFSSEKDLYAIEDVPPGVWTLVASDANGRAFERRVEVREGEVTTVGEIHFPPLPAVRGRVLDPAGRPPAPLWVTFQQGDRKIRIETGSAGTFVTWLREGIWSILAEQEGFGPATATVEVSGDLSIELPDLRLTRLVAVSGRVLGVAPEIVVPWVEAQSEDGLASITIPVDQENRFSSSGLWPGTWTLTTDVDGRRVSTRFQILPGTTEKELDLDFANAEVMP